MEKKPLNILVVDDDISLTLFVSKTFTSAGHRVLTAQNNLKVQTLMKSERIDIAICDLVLPGHDGSDIIKDLKQFDRSIYCVLISGYYNESFDNYKVLVGADEVIGKPVEKEMLLSIVERRNQQLSGETKA
jgi:DNA-binding NtrC family response regulator